MIPDAIWKDQEQFTHEVRTQAEPDGWDNSHLSKVARTKELMLHLIAECNEVLDACGTWKAHVPKTNVVNRQQLLQELIDVEKYWIMLCQLWEYSPTDLETAYWMKSAAVRQRYSELWLANLDQTMVILDLDNVLADFTKGFTRYLVSEWSHVVHPNTAYAALEHHHWYDADTLNLTPKTWANIKHAFRTSGYFSTLPVMEGAQALIDQLHDAGAVVVALTSRPIDRYPNIYPETVQWMKTHRLDIDHIWWGVDKAERLKQANEQYHGFMANVWFAVDDDVKFVQQFADLGIRTYWLAPKEPVSVFALPDRVRWVPTLAAVIEDTLGLEKP